MQGMKLKAHRTLLKLDEVCERLGCTAKYYTNPRIRSGAAGLIDSLSGQGEFRPIKAPALQTGAKDNANRQAEKGSANTGQYLIAIHGPIEFSG